jgi:hypothetical protein
MRLNGAIREGRDNAINFVDTLVKGLFDAKAGSDSVAKGLEALSKSLASTAIKQLLSGDFEKAAVSAISAVVTWVASLVSHASDLKSTIDTLDRLNQLRLRFVQATNDTNTLQGQLAVFDANAVLQQIDEARKGGALMTALIQVQQAERLKIETDFQKQAAELEKQAADARLARQQSLEDRIFAATNDTSTLQGALAAQQRDFAKERLDEAKNGNLDLAQLTVAQQAEELALRKSFNDKAIEETKRAEQERNSTRSTARRQERRRLSQWARLRTVIDALSDRNACQCAVRLQCQSALGPSRQSSTPRTSSSRSPTISRRPPVRSMPQGRAIRTSAARSSVRGWRCRRCSDDRSGRGGNAQ